LNNCFKQQSLNQNSSHIRQNIAHFEVNRDDHSRGLLNRLTFVLYCIFTF
jgi:hypothetical protein